MGRKIMANIVSSSPRVKIDINVKRYKSMDGIEDKSLPTFIIGLTEAKKNIINFDILRKEYKEQNIWWTFSKTERGADYYEDIEKFSKYVIDDIVSRVKYKYVDLLDRKYTDVKRIIRYLENVDEEKTCYIDRDNFIFLYSRVHKKIWGFSLTTMYFYGIKSDVVNRLLKRSKSIEIIKDFGKIPYGVKKLIGNKIHDKIILYEYFL